MYDRRHGSDSIHLHRKMREQEEQERLKRKKENAAEKNSSTGNLSVSEPEDVSEKEADAIAKKVVNGQSAEIPNGSNNGASIQMKNNGENSGNASELQTQLSSSKGGGQSLDDVTRSEMESKMGTDFSEVKIHTDSNADAMSESVNAKAFAHGQDVYFRNGNYNPSSSEGKELLAHELVHTKQESGGNEKIQRSALVEWDKEVTDDDRYNALSVNERKDYDNKKNKGKASSLSDLKKIEKILKISATYNYYPSTPSLEDGSEMTLTQEVIDEVKRQYRVADSGLNFWPDIYWKGKDGTPHQIGVRFAIDFNPVPLPDKINKNDQYFADPLHNDQKIKDNPNQNVLELNNFQDKPAELGRDDWGKTAGLLSKKNISTITFSNNYKQATYTPIDGSPAQVYDTKTQAYELLQVIHSEIVRLGLQNDKDLQSNVSGLGSSKDVIIDLEKSAPKKFTYDQYYENPNVSPDAIDKMSIQQIFPQKSTTKTFTDAERKKRIASVVVHEIGHNMGMQHTDLGVMNKGMESISASIGDTPKAIKLTDSDAQINPQGASYYYMYLNVPTTELQASNVQFLVNRIRPMTNEDPHVRDKSGRLEPKSDIWSTKKQTAETYLKSTASFADNNSGVLKMLADPLLATLIVFPPEKASRLKSQGHIEKTDVPIMEAIASSGYMYTVDQWNSLSETARQYIITETLTSWETGIGGGYTYFENPSDMDAL